MKKLCKTIISALSACVLGISLAACDSGSTSTGNKPQPPQEPPVPPFVNPGDSLGGGGVVETPPAQTNSQSAEDALIAAGAADAGETEVPDGAVRITEATTLDKKGDYYITGEINGKIAFAKKSHVYLYNARLTATDAKTLAADKDLTITLIGDNVIENTFSTDTDKNRKNALAVDGDLTINGNGTLTIKSVKNGISANSITVKDATVSVEADKDGLHAEIGDYDKITEAPVFSYDDGGYVFLDNADITVTAASDGIQADTFVIIKNGSNVDVTAGGGAPARPTEATSSAADGKGIKAGTIDWGTDDNELTDGDYLVFIDNEGGSISINSNDDGIHSDGQVEIRKGGVTISTGDDGIHAATLLSVTGGEVRINSSYEGVESAKVEISGGALYVVSVDDGVNAADGTDSMPFRPNADCHMIISGGEVYVDAGGDGLDSNGTMLISGGKVFVSGPVNGNNAALDSDGGILINGGYVFAVGALGMVETPASNSAQYVVSYAHSSVIPEGTTITLTDAAGNAIVYFDSAKKCQSVIISCPELALGSSYAIYCDGDKLSDFTVSSTTTVIGSSGSFNPGGRPPQGGVGGGHRR